MYLKWYPRINVGALVGQVSSARNFVDTELQE